MNLQTIIVPAGGTYVETQPAKVLTVKTVSLPVTVVFDGGVSQVCNSGSIYDLREDGGFSSFFFANNNSAPVTIAYAIGDVPFAYSAADNSTSNAATYALGNLGITTGAAAAGGLPACDSYGFLQITNGMNLVVSGQNNGHRRQIITISVNSQSGYPVNLLDANGCAFMTIERGVQIALVTDATFIFSGSTGTAGVTIGQIFLSA